MKLEGLILESRYGQFQQQIKGPMEKQWLDGFPVDQQKIIVLEFDRYLCLVDDPEGNGMAQRQEWTDTEREYVSNALDRLIKNPSQRDFWVHQMVRPEKPWPTYDETHHNQISVIAAATGQVEAALTYETRGREAGPRESVVKKLRELQAEETSDNTVAEPVEDEALYAV